MGQSTSLVHTPRPSVARDRLESTSVTPPASIRAMSIAVSTWSATPMYISLHPVYVSLIEPCARRWYALVALMAAACELEPTSLIAQSFQLRRKPFENLKTFELTSDPFVFLWKHKVKCQDSTQ